MYDKVHWYVIHKKIISRASKNHQKLDLDKHICICIIMISETNGKSKLEKSPCVFAVERAG